MLWRVRDAATLASVVWLICVVLAAGLAVWSARPGSAGCRPTNEHIAATDDDGTDGYGQGDRLPTSTAVLEPAVERPVVLPLGRTRAVRTARSSLTVTPRSADDPAADEATVDGADAPTDGDGAKAAPPDAATDAPTELATAPAPDDATAAPAGEGASGTATPSEVPTGDQSATPPVLEDIVAPLPLQVRVNQFVREDGTNLRLRGRGTEDGDAKALVTANAFSRRGVVLVELCVDRDGEPIGAPGRYEGSVTIVDPLVTPADVSFVVVLAYPNAGLVALLTLVAIAVAAIYSWRVHDVGGDADEPIRFHDFFGWLRKWRGLFAVSTGTVAAYVAYSATYLSNSVWGTSVTQFTAIVGAVFTAFVTAATTIIAGSRMGRSSNGDTGGVRPQGSAQRQPQPPPPPEAPQR